MTPRFRLPGSACCHMTDFQVGGEAHAELGSDGPMPTHSARRRPARPIQVSWLSPATRRVNTEPANICTARSRSASGASWPSSRLGPGGTADSPAGARPLVGGAWPTPPDPRGCRSASPPPRGTLGETFVEFDEVRDQVGAGIDRRVGRQVRRAVAGDGRGDQVGLVAVPAVDGGSGHARLVRPRSPWRPGHSPDRPVGEGRPQ